MFIKKLLAILALFCVSITSSCGRPGNTETTAPRQVALPNIKDRPSPIISFYQTRGNATPTGEYEILPVIIALWEDGRVMWSHDRERGGFPYTEAQLSQDEVNSLLKRIDIRGFLNSGTSTKSMLVVSGASKSIVVRHGSDTLYLAAGHEFGAEAPTPPFVDYWDKLKEEFFAVIPDTGRPMPEARFKLEKYDTLTGDKIEFPNLKSHATTSTVTQ